MAVVTALTAAITVVGTVQKDASPQMPFQTQSSRPQAHTAEPVCWSISRDIKNQFTTPGGAGDR